MPLQFVRVAYSAYRDEKMARLCLTLKRRHARLHDIRGVGRYSCWACVEYLDGGRKKYIFGNSQFRNPVIAGIYKHDWVRYHGEASAVARVLDKCQTRLRRLNVTIADLVPKIYIELKPCRNCEPLLYNINPNLVVFYSFEYPDEVRAWRAAARQLCRR
jgi:hypothetical protein